MMRAMCLSELEQPLQGHLLGGYREFSRVSTDSRSLQAGELFVALAGDNFDGHDYLAQVAASGAVAALVSQAQEIDLPQ